MKVAIIFCLAAIAVSHVSSINLSEIIEEEWDLFKVCTKVFHVCSKGLMFCFVLLLGSI